MEKWPLVIFPNFLNLKKGFSNPEPEGQGGGIIMGVTRLLPRAILLHTDQFFYTFLHTTVEGALL